MDIFKTHEGCNATNIFLKYSIGGEGAVIPILSRYDNSKKNNKKKKSPGLLI